MDQPYTPPEGPPRESAPRVFDRIGMARLAAFSRRHYDLLSRSAISGLFPDTEDELRIAAEKQSDFLSGLLGGPPVYPQKHGPPRMRARHFPFAIDEAARAEWMRCFRQAFAESDGLGLDPAGQDRFLGWIEGFSRWMVNQAPGD